VTQCVDEGQLRAFLDGALSETERAVVERHLVGCETCTTSLEDVRGLASQVSARVTGYVPMPNSRAAFARIRNEIRSEPLVSNVVERHRLEAQLLTPTHPQFNNQRATRPWPVQWRFAFSGLAVATVMLAVLGALELFGPGRTDDGYGPASPTIVPDNSANPRIEYQPRVGYLAPDFSLADVQTNQLVSLSSLRGKPVWINFWGTWCPPCREEMPIMQSLYEKYAGQVEVVGISMGPRDYPEQVISYINQYGYNWTFVHDPDMTVMNSYIVQGIPASYFIDKDGVIRSITVGGAPATLLERELLKAITQAPVPVETTIIVEEPPAFTPTPAPATQIDPPRMPLEEFKALYDDPATRPLILDTRSKEAYDEGHIAGAISFPEADVDTRVGELPKDRLIIAYCQ